MSQVIFPNGTILKTLNANDLLEQSQTETEKFMSNMGIFNENLNDPISYIYHNFLHDSFKQSQM